MASERRRRGLTATVDLREGRREKKKKKKKRGLRHGAPWLGFLVGSKLLQDKNSKAA